MSSRIKSFAALFILSMCLVLLSACESSEIMNFDSSIVEAGDGQCVFPGSADEYIEAVNSIYEKENGEELFSELDKWELSHGERGIQIDSPMKIYSFCPGEEEAFWPIIYIYETEDGDNLESIQITYDHHNMRDNTHDKYMEICTYCIKALAPDIETEKALEYCRSINDAGFEKSVPYEEKDIYGKTPEKMFSIDNVGIYPYYVIGSRSNFCIVPLSDERKASYEKKGTEISVLSGK